MFLVLRFDAVQDLLAQIIGLLQTLGVYSTFTAGLQILIIFGLAFFIMRALTGSK